MPVTPTRYANGLLADLDAAVDRLAGILSASDRHPVTSSAPGADRTDPADTEESDTRHDD